MRRAAQTDAQGIAQTEHRAAQTDAQGAWAGRGADEHTQQPAAAPPPDF